MERYERYEIPATAAYSLLAETSRRRCKRGDMEAISNLELAVKRGYPITVHIETFVARLESKAIIACLYPVQARRWLHDHGYMEDNPNVL